MTHLATSVQGTRSIEKVDSNEILHWLLGGISAILSGVGTYLWKRLKELDSVREENTELKVENAVLKKEKEIAKRAARNLVSSRGDKLKK